MTNIDLYQDLSHASSRLVTRKYSTSFSRSIIYLEPEIRRNIYNIYGFVRVADEIVDTFHAHDKKLLLDRFVDDYHFAQQHGISTNPVLNAFVHTQNKYQIPQDLVDAFLESMYMDLGDMRSLSDNEYKKYIYGSAEVVGLMCLYVFLGGCGEKFNELKPYAQSLGSAFQKVNFLRDIQADYSQLNRTYFPNVNFGEFTENQKLEIEADIQKEFDHALKGIKKLPLTSKFAVYLAYRYYRGLFNIIRRTHSSVIFTKRIRVNNFEKMLLFSKIMVYKKLNLQAYMH